MPATREIIRTTCPRDCFDTCGIAVVKRHGVVAHVRGEKGGMVWGLEFKDHAGQTGQEWANAAVLACYRGDGNDGIHLLGPLARKVVRIAPPLTISEAEAHASTTLMHKVLAGLVEKPAPVPSPALAGAR